MEIDTVITLKNGKKYGILLESELSLEDYFLAVLLDENEVPTNVYAVFQHVLKDGKSYTKKIEDPFILNELVSDYQSQYSDMIEENQQ